jgi:DNA repair protein RAD50
MNDREQLIRDISIKHQLKGYDHTPLEKDKVLQFGSRLADLQRRQNTETETLQVRHD